MRNARIRCGDADERVDLGILAWSCATIEPIGSSTSGIQRSSARPSRKCSRSSAASARRLRRVDPLAALAAEPAAGGALPRRRRRRSRRSSSGPRTRASPTRRASSCERLAARYGARRVRHAAAPSEVAREIVGVDGADATSASTGSSSTRRRRPGPTAIHAFAARPPGPPEEKPLSAAFHYRTRGRPEAAARGSSRRSRARRSRDGLPHALGTDGARGAAAARRVEGHRRPALLARDGPAPRAVRRRRHDRPRRLRARSTGSSSRCASRSSRPRARELGERADVIVGSTERVPRAARSQL